MQSAAVRDRRCQPILDIPVTSASTFVLLMSSLAMVLALAAVENKGKPGYDGRGILGIVQALAAG